jgi:hypothetical protein
LTFFLAIASSRDWSKIHRELKIKKKKTGKYTNGGNFVSLA